MPSKPIRYMNKESEARSIYIITRMAQGATVQQIAKELEVSVGTVQNRVKRETEWWLQNMGNVVAQIKVMQTQQLSYIYGQAMQSWQLSAGVDEEGKVSKEGDVNYLNTAMKSLSEVRRIWNAEDKIEIMEDGNAVISPEKQGLAIDQLGEVLQVLENIQALPPGIDLSKVESQIIPSESTYAEIKESLEEDDEED